MAVQSDPTALRPDTKREGELPYLSYSRVAKYLLCPEQYRLYYVEGLRPKLQSASLEFGQAVHKALAAAFLEDRHPVAEFTRRWDAFKGAKLRYAYRENWGKLFERGQQLLGAFQEEHFDRLLNVQACEKPFSLDVSNLDVPFIGIVDLVAHLDDKLTVVDFKTAGSKYQEYEAAMSDQLSAYLLAEPRASQAALCVLVKTATPKIEWFVTKRTGADLDAYLQKVSLVGHQIAGRRFYKRPGKWCGQCDYLPICLGDHEQAQKTLVQVE